MSQVMEVAVPVACNLVRALKTVHFCDAFQARLSKPELGPVDAYRALFACTPVWVKALVKIRGMVAGVLGLRHGGAAGFQLAPDATFEVGQPAGMFSIRSIEPGEVIVGNNDKHLDFRISIYRSSSNNVEMVTVSTAVEIHNTMGRIYMFVIKPFHRCIARAMVQGAIDTGRL